MIAPLEPALGLARIPASLGPYRVLGTIGEGGMGVVLKVRRDGEAVDRALKMIHPHLMAAGGTVLRRFRREIAIARELDHPGIVKYLDHGSAGDVHYYVMELVEGHTLREKIERRGRFDAHGAAAIVRELATALDAMHRAGLVHRDLKPANVMIDQEGRVRLMDLGLTKSREATQITEVDHKLGTLLYLPPEYLIEDVYEPCGDLYQIGLILHEMVTGQQRFPRHWTCTRLEELRDVPPPPPPAELATPSTRELGAIHQRLLAPHPARRLVSAAELLTLLDGVPGLAEPGPRPARVAGPERPVATPLPREPAPRPAVREVARAGVRWTARLAAAARFLAGAIKVIVVVLTVSVSVGMAMLVPSILRRLGGH